MSWYHKSHTTCKLAFRVRSQERTIDFSETSMPTWPQHSSRLPPCPFSAFKHLSTDAPAISTPWNGEVPFTLRSASNVYLSLSYQIMRKWYVKDVQPRSLAINYDPIVSYRLFCHLVDWCIQMYPGVALSTPNYHFLASVWRVLLPSSKQT